MYYYLKDKLLDYRRRALSNNYAKFIDDIIKTENFNLLDEEKRLPLMFYVDVETTLLMLKEGANPNIVDKKKKSLLMRVAEIGDFGYVEMLLNNGANPDLIDINGLTASDYARVNGYEELSKFIKRYESKPRKELEDKLKVRKKFASLVDKYVETRDIEICDEERNTLLHYAVMFSDKDLVISLLENFANPNSINAHEMTPWLIAYEINNVELLEMLSVYGANFYLRNTWGALLIEQYIKNNNKGNVDKVLDYFNDNFIKDDMQKQLKRKWLNCK